MLTDPRRTLRSPIGGVAVLICGISLLCSTPASAHKRARLEASVSEETPATPSQPSQEPPTNQPTEPEASDPVEKTSRRERVQRRDIQGTQACSIDLATSSSVISGATTLSLTGTMSCAEAAEATNQTVTLYQKVAHTTGFETLTTASTDSNGAFQFTVPAPEANSVFYVRSGAAKSSRVAVKVAAQVTIESPVAGTQLPLGGGAHTDRAGASDGGGAVTFSGTVGSQGAGATVTLQREARAEVWHRIGEGQADDEGKYSIVHTFSRPGEAHIRVVVHCHGLCMTSASTPVTYQISARHSKRVSIQASADPLAYGLSMMITGTVMAAAENQPVILLAQTGAGKFTQIAEGTATAGSYSFSESPLQSTRYRVLSAGASSAVLNETVSEALTASPSAASVEVGEPLTFTGTITPSHEGQTVDLERRNSSGLGYHVVAAGIVSSTCAYSIAYTPAVAGGEELRVKAQGNNDVHGASSEVFKVQILPAG